MNEKELIESIEREQKEICQKYGAEYQPLDFSLKLGIAENFLSGILPLNGVRQRQEHSTCGWYLWASEQMSESDDFFQPLHVYHLLEKYPPIMKYLALPPGWRFLLADNYEDVWFDENLLNV